MIEYLYDAIRATGGQEFVVAALIQDSTGQFLVEGCSMSIFNDQEELIRVQGAHNSSTGEWAFIVPASATSGLPKGRYWYCINYNNNSLSFKQPLYLT